MIDRHRVMYASGNSGGEDRGVVDCSRHDARTHPAAAQGQASDCSVTRVHAGRGEDHLIRPPSDGGRDDLSRLIYRLRGKPTWPVKAQWIAPPSLLGLEPGVACFCEQGLARRAVQEDFGDGMRHASKLALYPRHSDIGSLGSGVFLASGKLGRRTSGRRRSKALSEPLKNAPPYTGDDGVFLR
jgi:hypothetical protein